MSCDVENVGAVFDLTSASVTCYWYLNCVLGCD